MWDRLQREVVDPGNCTHRGACVGLSPDFLEFRDTSRGPLPFPKRPERESDGDALSLTWAVCSGRGVPFPQLFHWMHRPWTDQLLGPNLGTYVAHATDPEIRRAAASGGVISRVLIHLLETRRIRAAVIVRQGIPVPERAAPFFARTRKEILSGAQSVYAVTPTLTILDQLEREPGPLAFVGLPEQIASLRMLQAAGHPGPQKIVLVAGPYRGTNMYFGSVRAFLRGQGVEDEVAITHVSWRAGEWPGYLEVRTADGRVFRAEKFYYNYLIPFFISRNCQITPDFSNELADLSVGDAWSPAFEKQGGGHSVVVPRSEGAKELLVELAAAGELSLEAVDRNAALAMHGHMLDFKKRGTFVRLDAAALLGHVIPDFGYRPASIPLSRKTVEAIISLSFLVCGWPVSRFLVSRVPTRVIGPSSTFYEKAGRAYPNPQNDGDSPAWILWFAEGRISGAVS